MRTIVDLNEHQNNALIMLSKKNKCSKAKLVREAVDLYLEKENQQLRNHFLDKAFGMWKDRGIDAVEYQRKMRAEWERRESNI